MVVERGKDGSVTIRSNNGVTSMGKVISSFTILDNKRKERFDHWVEDCGKLVNACPHTFDETEQYFLQLCEGLPLVQNDWRMRNFQLNVIMNYCKDKLEHQSSQFSFDMTNEEIEKWDKEDNAMREEAMNSCPEHFGLNIRGYYLPRTKRNAAFYENANIEAQKWLKHCDASIKRVQEQDIYFFFEESTEYCQSEGDGNNLMNHLIVFRGVSQEDIQKRTPRFLGYITALRVMGDLPDFIEE